MEGMTDMGKSELLYCEFNVHEAQTNRPDWSYNYTKGVVLPSLRTECHLTGNMCCELNLNVGTIQQPTAKITLNDTIERIMPIMSINQGKKEEVNTFLCLLHALKCIFTQSLRHFTMLFLKLDDMDHTFK